MTRLPRFLRYALVGIPLSIGLASCGGGDDPAKPKGNVYLFPPTDYAYVGDSVLGHDASYLLLRWKDGGCNAIQSETRKPVAISPTSSALSIRREGKRVWAEATSDRAKSDCEEADAGIDAFGLLPVAVVGEPVPIDGTCQPDKSSCRLRPMPSEVLANWICSLETVSVSKEERLRPGDLAECRTFDNARVARGPSSNL